MRSAVRGLIRLTCGWWVGVGAPVRGRVRVVLEHNPSDRVVLVDGVHVLDLSELEALEVEQALHQARTGRSLPGGCDGG